MLSLIIDSSINIVKTSQKTIHWQLKFTYNYLSSNIILHNKYISKNKGFTMLKLKCAACPALIK